MTVKERGRAVETRRSARIFRLPAGPGGCAIILGPKRGRQERPRRSVKKTHAKMKTEKWHFGKWRVFKKYAFLKTQIGYFKGGFV